MIDRCFIDTNVLVYACLGDDKLKHDKAWELFKKIDNKEIFISTQILSEIYSALNKNRVDSDFIKMYIFDVAYRTNVAVITFDTVKLCLELKDKYRFSYWDSLVLATALENKCGIIYSEDMNHSQLIENRLMIVNPFVD